MKISDFIDSYANHEGSYVEVILNEDKELETGDIIIDIGSNTGEEIELLLTTPATIYSFEPHPMFFEKLEREYRNTSGVQLFNEAAWDSDGEMELHYKKAPTHNNGGASLIAAKNQGNSEGSVYVKTIDTGAWIDRSFNEVAILKIDAEGAEFNILDSLMKHDVLSRCKCILYEDHERKIGSDSWHQKRKEVLEKLGVAING